MVSPLRGLSAEELATKLNAFLETRAKVPGEKLSLRRIEALTGIAHQRLSELLRVVRDPDFEGNGPGSRSLARITDALSSPALQLPITRARTVRIDAPMFTPESLRGLSRPDGARGFQFVYGADSYETGYGQTTLSDLYNDNPEDAIGLVPGGVGNISSVVWYIG